jgi:hypothetical protein
LGRAKVGEADGYLSTRKSEELLRDLLNAAD